LKPCKNAVFDQNYYQYQRERILWPCIRPCFFFFFFSSSFLPKLPKLPKERNHGFGGRVSVIYVTQNVIEIGID